MGPTPSHPFGPAAASNKMHCSRRRPHLTPGAHFSNHELLSRGVPVPSSHKKAAPHQRMWHYITFAKRNAVAKEVWSWVCGGFFVVMLCDRKGCKGRVAGAGAQVNPGHFLVWVLPGSPLSEWASQGGSVRSGGRLPEEAAAMGRAALRAPSWPGEARWGESGETPSHPPGRGGAGRGGGGGGRDQDIPEWTAPSSPRNSARLPPPSRHSPAALRGAASFYSDGADPRLFRVVTKPAARCRAGARGGRGSLSRRHPETGTERGAPRRPPRGRGSPAGRAAGLGDLPPGDGCGRRSPAGRAAAGVASGAAAGGWGGEAERIRPPGRVCGNRSGRSAAGTPGAAPSRLGHGGGSAAGEAAAGAGLVGSATGGLRAPGCNRWAWLSQRVPSAVQLNLGDNNNCVNVVVVVVIKMCFVPPEILR